MSEDNRCRADFWDESTGHCDCCGKQSRTIWGSLADSSGPRAVYFVQWTVDEPAHMPCFDLVVGAWGEGTAPADRVLVSLVYRPHPGGGSFLVVDGEGRRGNDRGLFGRALRREDVIGTPLANEAFALVDALWLTEPRIERIRDLDKLAAAAL